MTRLTAQQIEGLPEWMPVEGFPNYEVNCRNGLVRNAKTFRLHKPSPNGNGYLIVVLRKDSKAHTKKLHRLVANAAFSYYDIQTDGLLVMHLDEERHNPRIANLALGTQKENLAFPECKKRMFESRKGKRLSIETIKKLSKRVGAYQNGVLIMTFQSTADAHRNGFDSGAVSKCCLGKYKSYKGFQWRYLDATDTPTTMFSN